jgi:hypothetical protein
MQSSFDFILCLAGSSGSVVAARLSENANARVLLLEAGGTDGIESVQQVEQWFTNLGTERDWSYMTTPNPELANRSMVYPAGKMLGGGSSLNAAFWASGHRSDWDSYAALAGDDGWSYRQVLDLYRRIEDWRGPTDLARRHRGGIIPIEIYRDHGILADTVSSIFESPGIPFLESLDGALCEKAAGFSGPERNVLDGIKYNTFRAYLRDFRTRANLTVFTAALVQSVVFEGNRATAVDVVINGAAVVSPAVIDSLKRLVVWSPLLATILVLMGVPIPREFESMLYQIGSATAGVGLFASGLIIAAYRAKATAERLGNSSLKMVVQPVLMGSLVMMLGVAKLLGSQGVVMGALPTAALPVMLALNYRVSESEAASTKLLTTLAMIINTPIAIAWRECEVVSPKRARTAGINQVTGCFGW